MIQQLKVGGFDDNFSYIITDGKTPKAVIVDPDNVKHLVSELEEQKLELQAILVTHSHHDHVVGVLALVEKYGVPVYVHAKGKERLDIAGGHVVGVEDGDKIKVGGMEIKVLATPGHIDDAVCYWVGEGRGAPGVLTGDTLFVEGCGRADFAESDVEDLWKSLQRLVKLGDEVKVYPGHDYGSMPVSTIGWEKENNKYLLCGDFKKFRKMRIGS